MELAGLGTLWSVCGWGSFRPCRPVQSAGGWLGHRGAGSPGEARTETGGAGAERAAFQAPLRSPGGSVGFCVDQGAGAHEGPGLGAPALRGGCSHRHW